MARLWTSGAEVEVRTGFPDGTPTGTVTRDTGTFRSGAASYKCDSGAGNATAYISTESPAVSAVSTTSYVRCYVYLTANPSVVSTVVGNIATGTTTGFRLLTDGTVQLYVSGTAVGSPSAAIVTDSQWHLLEMMFTLDGTPQLTYIEARLDGVTVGTQSPAGAGASAGLAPRFGYSNAPGANNVMYVDDVGMNNDSGSANNTWLGSGKIVLLKPISDSAVGSGWTDDNASGSNIYTAVDNTPPAGIADTSSGGGNHQIRNASSNTANYDANLTTYTTAGVATGDTVNVVTPMICTGAPSATGAKSGSLVLVSNPAGATDSHGTYRASVNAGTYPTGWKWTKGTSQEAPSVTLGTSPVLRADITSGTATRIADVCFMGMYADYTPAVAALSPPFQQNIPVRYRL